MKKSTFIIILVLIIFGILEYRSNEARKKTDLASDAKVSSSADNSKNVHNTIAGASEKIKNPPSEAKKIIENIKAVIPALKEQHVNEAIEIHLKHGAVIKGRLLEKTDTGYKVEYDGREFSVDDAQIGSVKYITQHDAEWSYKNDIVVTKKNGVVCDGKITGINEKEISMSFDEGGGAAEINIPRSEVSYLTFAPFCDKETEVSEDNLKKLFPKMKVCKDGNVTIFTDSYETTVKWYKKTIRAVYTEIYFKFYPLFKDRKPQFQNFIVIFDDPVAYMEKTGMPFFIPGFFDPNEKVLYLYNMFGEMVENIIFDMIADATGRVNKAMDRVKDALNKRYDEFIEGKTKEFTDRFWKVYYIYKSNLTGETKEVLRHEFTHEIFHNWGLQSIIISKPDVDKDKLTEKKKRFVETTDWNEKRKLMDEMSKMVRPDEVEMAVAGSWLAEGLATYCQTDPIGGVNEELLFSFQDAEKKKELNPIEFFTNFEKGSFVGVINKYKYDLYAQSWAFISFLMARHKEQFMEYQEKMAQRMLKKGTGDAAENKDDLALLLACLNKDLPTLEKEFMEYMGTYQKAEDPFVKRYMESYDVWKDLLESHL